MAKSTTRKRKPSRKTAQQRPRDVRRESSPLARLAAFVTERYPFALESVVAAAARLEKIDGRRGPELAEALESIGKRVVFVFEAERFLVFHLMIAGRFQWRKAGAGLPGRIAGRGTASRDRCPHHDQRRPPW